jgi:hypothetical protein
MSAVFVSSEYVFYRTIDLLASDVDLRRVAVPSPCVFPSPQNTRKKKKKTFMLTHAERVAQEELGQAVFEPMALFGPVERPVFVIDESELPY